MKKSYIAGETDHLTQIALAHGFTTPKTLLDAPENKELFKKRTNPHVLFAGDEVFIPEKELREENRPTGQRHIFELELPLLELNVKLVNLRDQSILRPLEAESSAGRHPIEPQGELYKLPIPASETRVVFRATDPPKLEVITVVGRLDPVEEVSGQQQRLNNLGYLAGFSTTPDPEQFQWAVQEFQRDHQLKVDGIVGPATRTKLVQKHGV